MNILEVHAIYAYCVTYQEVHGHKHRHASSPPILTVRLSFVIAECCVFDIQPSKWRAVAAGLGYNLSTVLGPEVLKCLARELVHVIVTNL